MKFVSYSDPGHGWVKVKKSFLKELGLADKISRFSYERKDYAYLEEHRDLSLFVRMLEYKGIPFEFKNNYSNKSSKIRTYLSYQAAA